MSNAVTKSPALTDKKRLFVSEYLIDLNAGQAAVRAGVPARRARVSSKRSAGSRSVMPPTCSRSKAAS
jgi:phage terminase small subunit